MSTAEKQNLLLVCDVIKKMLHPLAKRTNPKRTTKDGPPLSFFDVFVFQVSVLVVIVIVLLLGYSFLER